MPEFFKQPGGQLRSRAFAGGQRGKHSFGFVTVDEAGRLPLPEAARQLFAIGPGDRLLLLGEEGNGLALLREQDFEAMLRGMRGG